MKKLHVKQTSLEELATQWGFRPVFASPYGDELYIQCTAEGVVNWDRASVYTLSELQIRGNFQVVKEKEKISRREDFCRRLDEAGVKYEITDVGNGEVQTEVVFKTRTSDEQWRRDILAVQGLIYHFSNRNWIKGDTYIYVMQNVHIFKFDDEDGDNEPDIRLSYKDAALLYGAIYFNVSPYLDKSRERVMENSPWIAELADASSNFIAKCKKAGIDVVPLKFTENE